MPLKDPFSLLAGADNYCVMGDPIVHSKSPQIHQLFAEQCRQNISYQAIRVEPGNFEQALKRFQALGGKGLNVTVPFKAEAWAAVSHRTERAEKAGAVNTIWFDEKGDSHGDTTDGIGLVRDMEANDIKLQGRHVLILGAGGAVRGVLGELLQGGVSSIMIANRTLLRAQQLAAAFCDEGDVQACHYSEIEVSSADLVINGSAAGLVGELPPIDPAIVADNDCYDMVYANGDTAFVAWAKTLEATKAIDGLGMLIEQAAESFYIWRGKRPDTDAVMRVMRLRG